MRLKATFTLENSVIIPVFTIIIVALMTLVIYMHDNVVVKNILFENAIEVEKASLVFNDSYLSENVRQNNMDAKASIEWKSVMLNNANVDTKVSKNSIVSECNAAFLLHNIGFIGEFTDIDRSVTVTRNYPPDFIRKTNASKKLLNDLKTDLQR